jgi:hypothetical protein
MESGIQGAWERRASREVDGVSYAGLELGFSLDFLERALLVSVCSVHCSHSATF